MDVTQTSVIYEYENILLGKRKSFIYSFSGGKEARSVAIGYIWNYIITRLLKLEPDEVSIYINKEIVNMLHVAVTFLNIDQLGTVNNINFPYLLSLSFPEKYHYDFKKQCMDEFEHVMKIGKYEGCTEKYQWQKKFFHGEDGVKRAEYLLNHVVYSYGVWDNTEKIYDSFSDPKEIGTFLRKYRLWKNVKVLFQGVPMNYLHASIPRRVSSDFLYGCYSYMSERPA